MPMNAIVYASQAVADLEPARLQALVRSAAEFNARIGVTGMLLHDGQRFLQYIEGPERELRQVYARICASSSHHEMMELARGQIDVRRFPDWALYLAPATPPVLRELVLSDWSALVRSRHGGARAGTAIDRLIGLIGNKAMALPVERISL